MGRVIHSEAAEARSPLEFGLGRVEDLARAMVRKAKARVGELEARSRELEADHAARVSRLEQEYAEKKAALAEEVRAMRETALAEVGRIRTEAREEGYRDGHEEGLEHGRTKGREEGQRGAVEEGRRRGYEEAFTEETARLGRETEDLVRGLNSMLGRIRREREGLLRSARNEIIHLACQIARKVVKREIREVESPVVANARKAIGLISERTGMVVRLNPVDIEAFERFRPEILGAFRDAGGFTVEAADDIERGGCEVISGRGRADMRIGTQLERIEEALVEEPIHG